MSTTGTSPAQDLWALLPAILRIRDAEGAVLTPGWLDPAARARLVELDAGFSAGTLTPAEADERELLAIQAQAGPLASLIAVFAEQVAVLEEDLEQLYDDQFIETCAEWVVPYIGDLIGYRTLHGVVPAVASPRAEVAHTIGFRRRKGTVAVLEQLARDVTGWNASAAEFFQRLIVTQYMNHIRPHCLASPDLRRWELLERVGGAFDTVMRTVDVRRIAQGRGRHNIPNVGIFLWRLNAYALRSSPAVAEAADRWRFHPLGIDQPLFSRPPTPDAIDDLATPRDVPAPISRRTLDAAMGDSYDDATLKSLRLWVGPPGALEAIPTAQVCSCNLADDGADWAHTPAAGMYAVDPRLGRLRLPPDAPADAEVRVDFHYGFSADLGGGEYERAASYESVEPPPALLAVPDDLPTIQAALDALGAEGGVVVITDSGRYEETLAITAPAGKRVELRADNQHRPTLVLGGELLLTGGAQSEIRLNGLLLCGAALRVPAAAGNELARLDLRHCTLVPGLTLAPDSEPQSPDTPSLSVDIPDLQLALTRCITGGLRLDEHASAALVDCIVDATRATGVAFAALDDAGAGGDLSLDACTVIGKVHATSLPLVSNSILLARLQEADTWAAPVHAERRQTGCVRFTWLPAGSRVPRRHHCWPESASSPELATLRFTTLRYGLPAYAQLSSGSGAELLTGADDEGQPGAFHHLHQPQRETNLRVRLAEYLRVGLQAGILHET